MSEVDPVRVKLLAEIEEFQSKIDSAKAKIKELGDQAGPDGAGGKFSWLSNLLHGHAAEGVEAFKGHSEGLAQVLEGDLGGALNSVTSGLEATGGALGAVVGVMAVVGGTALALGNEFAVWGNHLENLSIKTGISATELAKWDESASVTGVSAEQMSTSMVRLGIQLEQGTSKAREGVQKLGLDFDTLRSESDPERLKDVEKAITSLGPASDTARTAMKELFGRGGMALLPAFTQDAANLRDQIGSVIGNEDEAAEVAKKWAEKTAVLTAEWEKFKHTIGETVAESGVLDKLAGGIGAINDLFDKGTPLGERWAKFADAHGGDARNQVGLYDASQEDHGEMGHGEGGHGEAHAEQQKKIDYTISSMAPSAEALKTYVAAQSELDSAIASTFDPLDQQVMKIEATTRAKVADLRATAEQLQDQGKSNQAILDSIPLIEQAAAVQKHLVEQRYDEALAIREQTEKDKAYSAAKKDGESIDAQLLKSQQALSKAAADSISPYNAQILKIHEEKEATIDAAQAAFKKYEAEASLSGISADVVDGVRKETNEVINNAAEVEKAELNTLKLAQAQKDMGDIAKIVAGNESRLNEELKMIGTTADGIAGKLSGLGGAIGGGLGGALGDVGQAFSSYGDFQKAFFTGDVVGMVTSGIGVAKNLVGAVKNLFGGKSEAEKIGEELGADVTDGLLKSIEDTEKSAGVSRSLAIMLNADDIFKETGKTDAMFDLMNAVALGAVDAKKGVEELGDAFNDLVTEAESGNTAAEASMINMIQRSKELGETIPGMQEYIDGLINDASENLAAFFSGQGMADGAGGVLHGASSDEQAAANQEIFGAVFSAKASTEGVVAASESMGDAIDALIENLDLANNPDRQLSGAAAQAIAMRDLIEDSPLFKGAAESATAGSKILKDLTDSGSLTGKTSKAFETSAKSSYDQAYNAAIEKGWNPDDARVAAEEADMPLLAQLRHAEVLGTKLTPETEDMLRRAQEDGTLPMLSVQDKQLLTQEQMRDGIFKLAGIPIVPDNNGGGGDGGGDSGGAPPPTGGGGPTPPESRGGGRDTHGPNSSFRGGDTHVHIATHVGTAEHLADLIANEVKKGHRGMNEAIESTAWGRRR